MKELSLTTGWATLRLPSPAPKSYRLIDYLDVDDAQAWWETEQVDKHYRMMSEPHRRAVDRWLSSGSREVATIYRRIRQGQQRAEVRLDGVAGCLRTPRGGSARQIVLATNDGQLRMRWMSPREYGRLQGVDDWPETDATTKALFGFGDAVCVPVICWIDEQILTPLFETCNA
jgi:DNA (cytosine-5)-methyltransferase 1